MQQRQQVNLHVRNERRQYRGTYKAVEGEEEESKLDIAEAPHYIKPIPKHNKFYTTYSPDVIFEELVYYCKSKERIFEVKREKCKMVIKVLPDTQEDEPLEIKVRIWQVPDQKKHCVEFEKKNCEYFRFYEIIKDIMAFLSDFDDTNDSI